MAHALKNVLSRITGLAGRRPEPPDDTFYHSTLANSLVDGLSSRLGKPCALIDFQATRTGSLVVRVRADRPYVAKLPLRATTEPRLRKNADTLDSLSRAAWMTPDLSASIPVIVLRGTVLEQFYSVETTVSGKDGASLARAGASQEALVRSAAGFLAELHEASARMAAEAAWRPAFEASVGRVERLADKAGAGTPYRALVSTIRHRLAAEPLPSVFSHGNFWLGNALFDRTARLTGVIDWDCSVDASLPALDFIYLLIRTHSTTRSVSFGEGLADWIDAASVPQLDRLVADYCRRISLPVDLIVTLSYCAWLEHIDQHCRFGTSASTNSRWVHRNLVQVLERSQLDATLCDRVARRWSASGR